MQRRLTMTVLGLKIVFKLKLQARVTKQYCVVCYEVNYLSSSVWKSNREVIRTVHVVQSTDLCVLCLNGYGQHARTRYYTAHSLKADHDHIARTVQHLFYAIRPRHYRSRTTFVLSRRDYGITGTLDIMGDRATPTPKGRCGWRRPARSTCADRQLVPPIAVRGAQCPIPGANPPSSQEPGLTARTYSP